MYNKVIPQLLTFRSHYWNMKIRVTNHSNGSTIHHPVILIRGCVENYSTDVWRKHSRSSVLVMLHTKVDQEKNANEMERLISEIPMVKLKFKVVVKLHQGDNEIKFDFLGVKDILRISFKPSYTPYFVRLVYIVCKDDDGRFQSPTHLNNSIDVAIKKIRVAGQVLQCCMAELIWTQNLGRKTFRLESDSITGDPIVHIHHINITRQESYKMSAESLWEFLGRDILTSSIGDKKVKYLAFLSSTMYQNPKKIKPISHHETLKMTKGHIALGGGGLALFGTGCLWTWPTTVTSVQSTLCDTTPVDPCLYMDDSGYRGTVGGCVATTIGGVLHELGHTLDLGHTEDGVMSRGFDDLDSLLTIISEKGGSRSGQGTEGRRALTPCGRGPSPEQTKQPLILPPKSTNISSNQSPRFTSVRRSDSISKYLEKYSEKRILGDSTSEGGCYWTRSCALLLAHQPWIRKGHFNPCSAELRISKHQVESCCTLAVVELRGKKGLVHQSWESEPEADSRFLELEGQMAVTTEHTELVAMSSCGKLNKYLLIE